MNCCRLLSYILIIRTSSCFVLKTTSYSGRPHSECSLKRWFPQLAQKCAAQLRQHSLSLHIPTLAPLLPFGDKLMVFTVEDLRPACQGSFSLERGELAVFDTWNEHLLLAPKFSKQVSSHYRLVLGRNSPQLSSQPSHHSPSNPSAGHDVYKKTTWQWLSCHSIMTSAQHADQYHLIFLLHSPGFIQYRILLFSGSGPEGAPNLPKQWWKLLLSSVLNTTQY